MTSADWRALLEAYLGGRLSAEAFMRRFIEGWQAGESLPRAIQSLQVAVEQFEAEVRAAGEEGAVNDDDLRQAAQRALAQLEDGPSVASSTFDRTRARDEMRRFQVRMSGCAGLGCVFAAVWVGLCVLQVVFVSDWVQHSFGWSAWPSAFLGFFLAFTPVIGNVLAFLAATELRGWPAGYAAIVFFAAPALTLISGWSRWRRR